MTTPLAVQPGDLVTLDPSDEKLIAFDHRLQLRDGASVSSVTFTITAIKQLGATVLTKDNETRLTAVQATAALGETVADDNVATQVRLLAATATVGDQYAVASKIVTTDAPPQTKELSIRVLIQNL